MQLADGHVQGGLVGVFQMQKLLQHRLALVVHALTHVHVDQAPVPAYAVRTVDHRVADLQFRQIAYQRFNITDFFLLAPASERGAGREQFGFSDQIYAVFQPCKTGVQLADSHAECVAAVYEFLQAVKHPGLYS